MRFNQHTLALGMSGTGKSSRAVEQIIQQLTQRELNDNDSAACDSTEIPENKAFIVQDPHPTGMKALILKSKGKSHGEGEGP